ncbi:MAG: GNAT family N-acetyltransferase [Chloroflexota bacterium]
MLIRLGTARLGESVVIREATAADARGIREVVRRTSQEPGDSLISDHEHIDYSEQQHRQQIRRLTGRPNDLMLVAEVISQSSIVAVLTCRCKTHPSRQHVVTMGITVQKEWRGKGIGTRLVQEAIRWARRNGNIRRIELDVLARNTEIVALYSKLGFRVEGRGIGAVYRDGEYVDNYWMALSVVSESTKTW